MSRGDTPNPYPDNPGIPAGGEGGELPAHSNSVWSESEASRMKSRRGSSPKQVHLPGRRDFRKFPAIPELRPAGVPLSPTGDLGHAKQREAIAIFGATLKKTGSHAVTPSQEIPLKKEFAK